MKASVSRALMALATRCLGEYRRDWALAMEAEYQAAAEAGAPLAFAAGCLLSAVREMPNHLEGRLSLANHAIALGLLVPMAVLQITRGIGLTAVLLGPNSASMVEAGIGPNPYVIWSHFTAAPALLVLWLVLGIGHLSLAWVLVERDWTGVINSGALIGAAAITLFLFMGVFLLDLASLASEAPVLAIELGVVLAVARGDARLSASTIPSPAI